MKIDVLLPVICTFGSEDLLGSYEGIMSSLLTSGHSNVGLVPFCSVSLP